MLHPQGNRTENSVQKKDDLLKEMNNALMVVASLIATVTFQASLNPPVGVWQDTRIDPVSTPTSTPYISHDRGVNNICFWFQLFILICFSLSIP
ncbi:hypothetical protein Patl1_14539 [Pistacia atlantica]|uniref:Uncharacterized protein n=1 Tax=Pistacia atlantica TaxID=434234 RepID=A0ACC1AUZ5_9ROSI|nr:hypothetical protein Patl1_14539 [Pistacia atlantica]